MRKQLVRFLLWLVRVLGVEIREIERPELVLVALELCKQQDQLSAPGTSGTYKRINVLAGLQKRFPRESKRALSRAVEDALD